jgi:hypothetical protein
LIANILDPSSLIFGCISEVEPGFVASVLIAAGIAGCSLEGIAIRPEEDQAQIVWKWRKNPEPAQIKATPIESRILAAKRYLESRGEPASYLNTITAAFINIIQLTIFQQEQSFIDKKSQSEMQVKMSSDSDQYEISPSVIYSKIYNSAREALSYRSGFLRFNLQDVSAAEASPRNQIGQGTLFSLETEDKRVDEEEASTLESLSSEEITSSEKERPTRSSDISESTLLWLRETDYVNHLSISDRFEMDLVDYLAYHPGSSLEDIDKSMCNFFPGLFTPDPEFIRTCLESYGEQDSLTNRWHIRHEDKPEERILDLERSHNYLHQIADRLGITYRDHLTDGLITSISWLDTTGNLDFWFFTTTTATIGKIVLYNDLNPSKGIIVLPGSRANLVIYRLRRDPRLNKAFNLTQGNWRFLKFRHLKSLVENPLLRQENLGQFLELDPLTYSTLQMRLI